MGIGTRDGECDDKTCREEKVPDTCVLTVCFESTDMFPPRIASVIVPMGDLQPVDV